MYYFHKVTSPTLTMPHKAYPSSIVLERIFPEDHYILPICFAVR